MPISLSFDSWPIVLYVVNGTLTSEVEVQEYIHRIDALLTRRAPYCSVIDLTQASPPSAALRRRQAEWQRQNLAALRKYCRGAAFVTPSRVLRGAMIAIGWLQPWPHPVDYFDRRPEAWAWAEARVGMTDLGTEKDRTR